MFGAPLYVQETPYVPKAFVLHQNYPNPFNPRTTIGFDLPEAARIQLVIYDILGREVVRLVDRYLEPGHHAVIWNGKTAAGMEVSTGLYVGYLVAPQFAKSIKMVLLK